MRMSRPLIPIAAAAAAAVLMGSAAQAAPAASAKALAAERTSSVEKAAYRHCWWSDGRRHCRWVDGDGPRYRSYGYRSYGYGVGEGRPEDYRIGSTEWWRAMDREDRGGFRR